MWHDEHLWALAIVALLDDRIAVWQSRPSPRNRARVARYQAEREARYGAWGPYSDGQDDEERSGNND